MFVIFRSTGSGFPSSLGSGGRGNGERFAVIAGSLGGVILVVGLIATYCYCFPLARGSNSNDEHRKRNNQGDDNLTPHKNDGNGAAIPLVNGGSLVVTSASRGSVLLNVSGDVGGNLDGGFNNCTSQSSLLRQRQNGGSNNLSNQNRVLNMHNDGVDGVGNGRNEEFPRALEPQLRNSDNSGIVDNNRQTLSMSIPDVTRVEPQGGDSLTFQTEAVQQPQFFTLGRMTNRNNHNNSDNSSSSASPVPSRHSFHDKAGTSNLGGIVGLGESNHQPSFNRFHHQQDLPQHPQHPKVPQQHHSAFNPRRASQHSNNGANPFSGLYRTNSTTDQREDYSEGGSLYRDGSLGGDSLNETLLCDDRTASPPPPAPSGPPAEGGTGTTRTSPYTPLNRRSLAMI